jgi:prepilin-type N-terminal cleavage/methylation domain-containing protein
MNAKRRQSGFTLIELLVVMAIIATLAGLGVTQIPKMLRSADITKSQDNLKQIGTLLRIYEMEKKGLPRADGANFVMALWGRGVDKNAKSAEVFFCPSTGNRPAADLSNVTAAGIDYTGPDLSTYKGRNWISTSDNNAAVIGIAANKIPSPNDGRPLEEIKKDMPHKGYGVCVLYLDGGTGFIDAEEFSDGLVQFGPDSSNERLRLLKPGFGDE